MKTPDHRFEMGVVLERLADQAERMLAALPLLALAVLVLIAAWFIGGWISHRAVLARVSKRNPFLQDLARATVRWVFVALGMIVALEIMSATKLVGAVLGTAGVLGIALGFAFKDILENYLAGVLMSLRQPFAPRDHVVIDGNEGIIVALNARATILMTLEGNHLRLPNALVSAASRSTTRETRNDACISMSASVWMRMWAMRSTSVSRNSSACPASSTIHRRARWCASSGTGAWWCSTRPGSISARTTSCW